MTSCSKSKLDVPSDLTGTSSSPSPTTTNTSSSSSEISVTVEQSVSATVGKCRFTNTTDPTKSVGFSYRVSFSKAIDTSSFTTSDIANAGTGGGAGIAWTLTSCGDNLNFKLTATSVSGDGTIMPYLSAGAVQDSLGNKNALSTSTDNSITLDKTGPEVSITRASEEIIGSCTFIKTAAQTNLSTINYRVTFSEAINTSTLSIGDINQGGTAKTGTVWTIVNCGDNKNFKLAVSGITSDGTIEATMDASKVRDLAGNNNTASNTTNITVTKDTIAPDVVINNAIDEIVGDCHFSAVNNPETTAGFSYQVSFSKAIDPATFTTSDIVNGGTGGDTTLTWTIQNCGDDTHFKLSATQVVGDGTIEPQILFSTIQDMAQNNNNTYSTSTSNSIVFDGAAPSLTINRSITESIGSCSFSATSSLVNTVGFTYKVRFSEVIDPATFSDSDITNLGTGGGTGLTWGIESCGDNRTFKLTAQSVVGDGTIIPKVLSNLVQDSFSKNNTASTGTDSSVNFDSTIPSIDINQAVTENIGTCHFIAPSDPSSSAGLSYKITFSEAINTATFSVSDIVNSGTGGYMNLIWDLSNCGDNIHFKLTANTIVGDGTIIPRILANTLQDPAGNGNTLSSSSVDNSITYDSPNFEVTINKAITETVGSCNFSASNNPTYLSGFSYRVSFSDTINTATLTLSDILNTAGTGGATSLIWSIVNCGDDKNFMLTALTIIGDGTIIPSIAGSQVKDTSNHDNSPSTSSGIPMTFDSIPPAVTINQAINETVGTCTFTAASDPARYAGFSFKISFSEKINVPNFTTGLIVNAGAGGSTTLDWVLTNCGDDKNFKLTANTVVGNGVIKPQILANSVDDLAGNYNSLSTATDNIVKFSNIVGWGQEAYIKPVNNSAGAYFGWAVSLSGDTLAVGAKAESSNESTITNGATASVDTSYFNSGAVYVYKRSDYEWSQEAYIKAQNNAQFNQDQFGESLSLSGDTLAVGSIGESSSQTTISNVINSQTVAANSGSAYSGAVYIYKRTGGIWALEAYIKASNNDSGDNFRVVSLNGNSLVVGATDEASNSTTITNGSTASADNTALRSGAAYLYKRTGAVWVQEAYIKASNANADDAFGSALSLNGDTLAVGASEEDSNETIITNGSISSLDNSKISTGAVYIYRRSSAGWGQEAYIKASNNSLNGTYFGGALSLSGDTLAVGSTGESSNQLTITNGSTASSDQSSSGSGAVYIYKRTGTSWAQEAYVKASNTRASLSFGKSVSLNGNTLAVGAIGDPSNQTSIINGTGTSIHMGSPNSGAVFVYKRTGANWIQEVYIKSSNSRSNDQFGRSVSLSGDTLAVGVPYEDNAEQTITNGEMANFYGGSNESGAVYVYRSTHARLFDPADISLSSPTTSSINLSWSASGLNVTGYKIAYVLGAVAPANCSSGIVVNVGNVLTYSLTGLTSGSSYSYRICSYDSAGNMSEGYVSHFSTTSLVPEVASLNWHSNTSTTITLDWTSGGGSTIGYKLARNSGKTPPQDCSSGTIIDVGNVLTYQVSGLSADSYYAFRVCSYDSSSHLSFGQYASMKTAAIPSPTNLILTSASATSVALNWTSGGGDSIGFKVTWSTSGVMPANCNTGTIVDVASATSYTITGLASNSMVQVRVCAYAITGGDLSSGTEGEGSVLVYGWKQEAYIKAGNSEAYDKFGASLSLSGDTLAVGAEQECSNQTTITNGILSSSNNDNTYSGAVYLYKRTGANWSQEAYVKASNNDIGDYFGRAVALHGDTLAVSAPSEASNETTITNGSGASSNNSNYSSGAVYIYKRSAGNWGQEAYIKAANSQSGVQFGGALALNGDTLAVGAPYEMSNETMITNGATASADTNASSSGAVYVYKRVGSSWSQEAYIKASNAEAGDQFGSSISLNGDTLSVASIVEASNQTTITNGTTGSADNSNYYNGAVYVYKRTGSTWVQEAYVKPPVAVDVAVFGKSISLAGDGLAVGALYENGNQNVASSDLVSGGGGAVFLYKRSGANWSQVTYLKASNNTSNNYFGGAVSLSADTLAVGAINESSNQTSITNGANASSNTTHSNSGATYVYKKTGESWNQEAYIKASNNDSNDAFGSVVSLSADTLAVGVPAEASNQTTITNGITASLNNDNTNSGAVYIYRNNARLFEIFDLTSTSTSSSITLNWSKTGGSATGYYYTYQMGSVAPATCKNGSWQDIGNNNTITVNSLSALSTYSFRVCAYADGTLYTDGAVLTTTTLP